MATPLYSRISSAAKKQGIPEGEVASQVVPMLLESAKKKGLEGEALTGQMRNWGVPENVWNPGFEAPSPVVEAVAQGATEILPDVGAGLGSVAGAVVAPRVGIPPAYGAVGGAFVGGAGGEIVRQAISPEVSVSLPGAAAVGAFQAGTELAGFFAAPFVKAMAKEHRIPGMQTTIRNSIYEYFRWSNPRKDAANRLMQIFVDRGIPVRTGDLMNSPLLNKYEEMLMQVPFTGARPARLSQLKDASKAVTEFLQDLKGSGGLDELTPEYILAEMVSHMNAKALESIRSVVPEAGLDAAFRQEYSRGLGSVVQDLLGSGNAAIRKLAKSDVDTTAYDTFIQSKRAMEIALKAAKKFDPKKAAGELFKPGSPGYKQSLKDWDELVRRSEEVYKEMNGTVELLTAARPEQFVGAKGITETQKVANTLRKAMIRDAAIPADSENSVRRLFFSKMSADAFDKNGQLIPGALTTWARNIRQELGISPTALPAEIRKQAEKGISRMSSESPRISNFYTSVFGGPKRSVEVARKNVEEFLELARAVDSVAERGQIAIKVNPAVYAGSAGALGFAVAKVPEVAVPALMVLAGARLPAEALPAALVNSRTRSHLLAALRTAPMETLVSETVEQLPRELAAAFRPREDSERKEFLGHIRKVWDSVGRKAPKDLVEPMPLPPAAPTAAIAQPQAPAYGMEPMQAPEIPAAQAPGTTTRQGAVSSLMDRVAEQRLRASMRGRAYNPT